MSSRCALNASQLPAHMCPCREECIITAILLSQLGGGSRRGWPQKCLPPALSHRCHCLPAWQRESKKEGKGPTLEGSDVGYSARKKASVLPSKGKFRALASKFNFPSLTVKRNIPRKVSLSLFSASSPKMIYTRG
ncbi:hypothetical protein NQZ68_032074 [Dissostichus eleginoides]|nr:hypothetical protein NQZ68_032074 [Dissostichus eleginoides]